MTAKQKALSLTTRLEELGVVITTDVDAAIQRAFAEPEPAGRFRDAWEFVSDNDGVVLDILDLNNNRSIQLEVTAVQLRGALAYLSEQEAGS